MGDGRNSLLQLRMLTQSLLQSAFSSCSRGYRAGCISGVTYKNCSPCCPIWPAQARLCKKGYREAGSCCSQWMECLQKAVAGFTKAMRNPESRQHPQVLLPWHRCLLLPPVSREPYWSPSHDNQAAGG